MQPLISSRYAFAQGAADFSIDIEEFACGQSSMRVLQH